MKTIVGIFAHPDDEAFCTGGTIAKYAKSADVYLICVTKGDAVQKDKDFQRKIGIIRKGELLESARILGVKKVFFYGYHDGSLCHNLYHEIAEKLQSSLELLLPDTLITFEPRGISGHIDHITVSMVVSYVFEKLPFCRNLLYFCENEEYRKLIKEYFIFFPPGYKYSEINKTINIEKEWDTKISAMKAHKSQNEDVEKVLRWRMKMPKKEYFLEITK